MRSTNVLLICLPRPRTAGITFDGFEEAKADPPLVGGQLLQQCQFGLRPRSIRIAIAMVATAVYFAGTFPSFGQGTEADYYPLISVTTSTTLTDSRSATWKPAPDGVPLEISGIAVLPQRELAVAIRKGEVWRIRGAYDDPPENVTYQRIAHALHEPLGLLQDNDSLYVTQRAELTRLVDTTRDGVADLYQSVANDWGLTGHYHEYAYGPERDADGNLWLTLNIGMGLGANELRHATTHSQLGYKQAKWRGWGLVVTPTGELRPMCAGMRSPAGLGANAAGDVFYTDQQGNWVPTNSLHHLRKGVFYHHPEALASAEDPRSPLPEILSMPNGVPYPEAIGQVPSMVPPAVWFPYKKMGQSTTDIMLDASQGQFGPFAGQLFVGEFTLAGVSRVFLEKIDGQYQGACFPFRSGLSSAVLRLAQGQDGSVFVGLTNRGWSSLGNASYGLERLVWSGKTPFEMQEIRALPTGFELRLTRPVSTETAARADSYRIRSYTYLHQAKYGSDEILQRDLEVTSVEVSADGYRVRLGVSGLRPLFVHEVHAQGLRDEAGHPLLHPVGFYTLNQIPGSEPQQ